MRRRRLRPVFSIRLPFLAWIVVGPIMAMGALFYWIIKGSALGLVALVHYIQEKRYQRSLAEFESRELIDGGVVTASDL
jgi:hypothetical protein